MEGFSEVFAGGYPRGADDRRFFGLRPDEGGRGQGGRARVADGLPGVHLRGADETLLHSFMIFARLIISKFIFRWGNLNDYRWCTPRSNHKPN